MTHVLKSALAAGATVACIALTMSGPVAAQTYPQDGRNGVRMQDGPNGFGGTVVSGGAIIGQDPDLGVRSSLYREDHSSGQ
jgi:hypothetical protein